MRITEKQLKQLIKEEVKNLLKEDLFLPPARDIPTALSSTETAFDQIVAQLRRLSEMYSSASDTSEAARKAQTALEQVLAARTAFRARTPVPGVIPMQTY